MIIPSDENQHKRLDEIRAFDCRWPTNRGDDGEWRFCSHVVKIGYPYCQRHKRLAYTERSK